MYSRAFSISFAVRIPSGSDGNCLEYEFGFNEIFGKFVLDRVSELIDRKLLNPGEFYDYYMLPHYDDLLVQGKENVKIENSLQPIDQIYFSDTDEISIPDETLREQPVKYFELIIKSLPARITYSRFISISEVKPYIDQVVPVSSKLPKKIAGTASYPFTIIAKIGQDRDINPTSKVLIIASDKLVPHQNLVIESTEEELDAINIDLSRETISQSALLTDFGDLSKINDDINISVLLEREPHRRLLEQASGIFGMLIGTVYKKDDQVGYIIEIKEFVSVGSYTYGLPLKIDDFANSLRIIETRFPNDKILGWYRTSTDFDLGLRKTDQTSHKMLFPEEWQCFLLVRSDIGNISSFISVGDSLVFTSEFYVKEKG